MENDDEYWSKLWQSGDNASSFSGLTNFQLANPQSNRQRIKNDIFPRLITYTKYRTAKPPKVYNPYFVRTLRKVIQSDIIFMKDPNTMVRANRGFQYILIVMDVFSRKIWARPLKKKDADSVKQELRNFFEQMVPFHREARFVIDRGTEFLNLNVLEMINNHGLTVTHPSDGHAAHVERANLSLQRIIYQKMEQQGGKRKWLDFLQPAVKIMNNRHHRIIKMSPNEAEKKRNRLKVNYAMAIYRQKAHDKGYKNRKKSPSFKVGDRVRIKKEKKVFSRGYQQTFTTEVFKVKKVLNKLPVTMYTLQEWDEKEELEGNFYAEELSLVKGDVFKIEKVIRRKNINGRMRAFVKWEGFPAKYNSWVDAASISRRT